MLRGGGALLPAGRGRVPLWTPTHYDTLYGLQGRYFLPVLPLLLLTCLPRRLAAVPDEDTARPALWLRLHWYRRGWS